MNCPSCQSVNLVMSERQGIEIDYCPQCRGVWLDRGELDKIIDRSMDELSARAEPGARDPYRREDSHHGGHYKKRRGFLSELFD
ncbi:MAG: hypothetical protein UZ17_ACD001002910 [Acidobacteria bacterium OLB17]|nr:MAG: hypothetical protein UZ17_ACD001002910 [Acidobacteria bacterium OLB17]MCZ2391604.1 zf-TFIIB domain-containing protein [Acidobacteriota bacterium]